jgi:hypothetical protein
MPTDELTTKHPYNDTTGRFEKIAEVYLGGYQWGIACVFRDRNSGRLYGDTDGGCSCYGPFDEAEWERINFSQCVEITHERDAAELLDQISGEDAYEPSTTQRRDFCNNVRAALSAQRN